MNKFLTSIFLVFLVTFNIAAQTGKVSPTVLKQIVEQMIREGELTKNCLTEGGGYQKAVYTEYRNYNRDRIPEVVVVQKAGCIASDRLPRTWIYRKLNTGYQKIYGPVAGGCLKQKTMTKGYYDVRVADTAGGDKDAEVIYKFDGRQYRESRQSDSLTSAALSKQVSKPANIQISPKRLRQQVMRDGLREEMSGCGSFSSVTITSQNIDLNNDEQSELVVTANSGCFGAHGFKVLVYRVINGKFSVLLTMNDGLFEMADGSTNGFRDITLVSGTLIDVYKYTYRYDGNSYQYSSGERYHRNEDDVLILQEVFDR